MLDIWPALPMAIRNVDPTSLLESADNTISALEHNDRVHGTTLRVDPAWLLDGDLATAMQRRFPVLMYLAVWSDEELAPPDSFLSGSAPHLGSLCLENLTFPMFRKLPLVASNLVALRLWDIPDPVYISLEAMVACLAALTSSKQLRLNSVPLDLDPVEQTDVHLR
jgi:hypothetical protein